MTTTVETTNHGHVTRTHSAPVTCARLFGGAANGYYAADARRQARVTILTNDRGQAFAHLQNGREYQPGSYVWDGTAGTCSPLTDSLAEVQAWSDAMLAWAPEGFTGRGDAWPVPVSTGTSVCPECGAFGSLRVELLAYGDRTTCATEGCTHDDYYSIGD